MKVYLSLLALLLLAGPGQAQNIVSIDCYPAWAAGSYTSCYRSLEATSATFNCACYARCGSNCLSINAKYRLYWAMTGGATGSGILDGRAESSGVKVQGTLLLYCGLVTKSGQGYDRQVCDTGQRSTFTFEVNCNGPGDGSGS